MVPFRGFFLKWVLARDRETLENWLALMEVTKMFVAIVFVVSLASSLMQTEFTRMFRCMMFTIISFIFLWFISVLQYLMAIEYNTRKDSGKK